MKLYLYNQQDGQIFSAIDIGDISDETKEAINTTISFLESNAITDRYKKLVLANGCKVVHDEDNENPVVKFK